MSENDLVYNFKEGKCHQEKEKPENKDRNKEGKNKLMLRIYSVGDIERIHLPLL